MMQIREIPLKDIKVKGRIREDKGDIAGLAATIRTKGLIQPITVDQNLKLLAGERRYLAHVHNKANTITAIVRQTDGVVDALEIELLENTQRKDLGWDERSRLEKKIYDHRKSVDKDWSYQNQAEYTGHSTGAISKRIQLAEAMELIPDLAEHKTMEDAFKEFKRLEEGIVVNAMLKKTPPHIAKAMEEASTHYQVGDAFGGMMAIEDKSVHFAEVDTPYGVDLDKRKSRNKDKKAMKNYDEWAGEDYMENFFMTLTETHRILKDNSFAVIWYGMSWHCQVTALIKKAGFTISDIPAIWAKGDAGQTASPDTTLGSCYEPFYLARKGKPVLAKPGRSNVFNYPKLPSTTKDHPTQKPLILMKEILATCLFPGSTIMVPFLGSGVTLRAAYKMGHTGFGWDLSEDYKRAFLKRVVDDQKEIDDGKEG